MATVPDRAFVIIAGHACGQRVEKVGFQYIAGQADEHEVCKAGGPAQYLFHILEHAKFDLVDFQNYLDFCLQAAEDRDAEIAWQDAQLAAWNYPVAKLRRQVAVRGIEPFRDL